MDGWFPRVFRTRFVLFERVEKRVTWWSQVHLTSLMGSKMLTLDTAKWSATMECNNYRLVPCWCRSSNLWVKYSQDHVTPVRRVSQSSLLYGESTRDVLPVLRWCTCSISRHYHRTRVVVRIESSTPSLCTRTTVLFVLSRCDIHPNQFQFWWLESDFKR